MGKGTLLVLVLLVAALAALWLQKEREVARGGPRLDEFPLCPALAAEQVRALRIEHLERSFQLKLERDAAGRWFLTDPLAYPAQGALVRSLLASLEGARGEPAPEVALGEVGLDPPRVVIECVQVSPTGEQRLRVELGAQDLDSALIYARVPGHPHAAAGGGDVFRTTRVLANTLERNPDDYRERRATQLTVQEVIALRRRGTAYLAEEGRRIDLAFDALLGPDGWKRAGQASVTLDPSGMGLLVRGATDLSVERFVDDSPRDLARYGLDAPAFTLELEVLSGPPVVLAFSHPPTLADVPIPELTWFCQRRGYAHVWEVRARDVELFTRPAELFFDQLVLRVLRTDVARLELEGGGARRVLAREKRGWSVWTAAGDAGASDDGAVRHAGDPARIEEALALLERVQLVEHFPGEAFEARQPPCAFTVVLANGARLGGALGRPTRDPKTAAEGVQFLRAGDEVVALIDAAVAELCLRPLDEFRSRKVHQLQESLVRAVELELPPARGGTSYTFVNTGDNVWSPEGQAIRAPQAFLQALDGLLNLGAKRWLEAAPEHEPVLSVRVLAADGTRTGVVFARRSDGSHVCLTEAGQAAEIEDAVVERLLAIF